MNTRWLWFTMMGALSAVACNKNGEDEGAVSPSDDDGPMEGAGEWTDQAAEDTEDAVQGPGEGTNDTPDEVRDDLDGTPN